METCDLWICRPEVSASPLCVVTRNFRIADNPEVSSVYFIGREPVIRISTSLLALCCQSGLVATLATPTRARRRSIG